MNGNRCWRSQLRCAEFSKCSLNSSEASNFLEKQTLAFTAQSSNPDISFPWPASGNSRLGETPSMSRDQIPYAVNGILSDNDVGRAGFVGFRALLSRSHAETNVIGKTIDQYGAVPCDFSESSELSRVTVP